MQVPSPEKKWTQTNDGYGNLFGTYNINLSTSRGKAKVSEPVLKAYDTTDDADMDSYTAAFAEYNTNLYGISDDMFRTTSPSDPTTNWSQPSGYTTVGNTITDMVVFDGLLLHSGATNIYSYDGSSNASWWTATLGQSALTSGDRHILEVGPDGNLYIVDGGNKIYRVTPAAVVSKTGAGTLDFSARPLTITTMVTNSTRMWVGFQSDDGRDTFIAEWDMGAQSISPNRLHLVGAKSVLCIAIWNDTPIALLSNGKFVYFNGTGFVEWENGQFPVASTNDEITEDFIHFNGWAIIDGLPHFLVSGIVETEDAEASRLLSDWNMPAGIYCLDPKVGLYHRFAVGAGSTTQTDNGQPALLNVGALYSTKNRKTKFLASYEYYDESGTRMAVIAYHDKTRNKPTRAWFATEWFESQAEVWGTVRALFKILNSGEAINIFYRQFEQDTINLTGTWADTTHFHTTETATGVAVGDTIFIKEGAGGGFWARISDIETSALTTVIEIESAISIISAGDVGTIQCTNFKKLGYITTTSKGWETISIPSIIKSRKIQLLVEQTQNAGSTNELDYVIIE